MGNRISKKLVSFAYPFTLDEIDGELAPGGYTIETEDQDLGGVSFVAHRTVATTIILRTRAGSRERTRYIEIDPNGLAAALILDESRTKAANAGNLDCEAAQRADNEGMSPA